MEGKEGPCDVCVTSSLGSQLLFPVKPCRLVPWSQDTMRRRTSKQRRCSSPGPTHPPREAEAPGKLTQKRVARLDRNWRGQLHHSTELLITEADCVSIHVKESVEPQGPAPRRAGKTRAASIARTLKRTEGATRQKAFSLGLSLDSR